MIKRFYVEFVALPNRVAYAP